MIESIPLRCPDCLGLLAMRNPTTNHWEHCRRCAGMGVIWRTTNEGPEESERDLAWEHRDLAVYH